MLILSESCQSLINSTKLWESGSIHLSRNSKVIRKYQSQVVRNIVSIFQEIQFIIFDQLDVTLYPHLDMHLLRFIKMILVNQSKHIFSYKVVQSCMNESAIFCMSCYVWWAWIWFQMTFYTMSKRNSQHSPVHGFSQGASSERQSVCKVWRNRNKNRCRRGAPQKAPWGWWERLPLCWSRR